MSEPSPRHLKKYAEKCLRLKSYLGSPGDGRTQPRLPAAALLWALLMGQFLAVSASPALKPWCVLPPVVLSRFPAVSAMTPWATSPSGPAPRSRGKRRSPQCAKPSATRPLITAASWAGGRWNGRGALAPESPPLVSSLPQPESRDPRLSPPSGHGQHRRGRFDVALGCGTLRPQDSEYDAGRRLLRRVVGNLGRRFAQYVVIHGPCPPLLGIICTAAP